MTLYQSDKIEKMGNSLKKKDFSVSSSGNINLIKGRQAKKSRYNFLETLNS